VKRQLVDRCGTKASTNQMPKESKKNIDVGNLEEIPIVKKCCHCDKQYCDKTHHRLFSLRRKVTKHNIERFNRLMTKPRKRKKQIGNIWCDECDLIYDARLKAEKRSLSRELDIEIEKNEKPGAESPETEEGEFKEDGTLTDAFLKAIACNLLFQIQISKN
jgi:hypothetical protein